MIRGTQTFDVLVAGAGPVGLTAAIACAKIGLKTCLVGRTDRRDTGRTVALLDGSLRFFDRLGLGERIERDSAPLEIMRIVDDTGSLFRSHPVEFASSEIGLTAFGRNIETGLLVEILHDAAIKTEDLTVEEGFLDDYVFAQDAIRARCEETVLSARLLVAADGAGSPARRAAGLSVRTWTYDQVALTAIFAHEKPHANASTEFHTRGGPFTLVPLPGTQDEPNRSSLVWIMRPSEALRRTQLPEPDLAEEVARQAQFLLGAMRVMGGVGQTPMTGLRAGRLAGRRIVLAGEAAHAFPPIGAQGLNLGLRDAAVLQQTLLRGRFDPGARAVLSSYQSRRAVDVALRTTAVDLFNRSLPTKALPVDFARGTGLLALDAIGPLRRAAMRAGLGPRVGA